MKSQSRCACVFPLVLMLATRMTSAAGPQYQIMELGPFPPSTQSSGAYGLNDSGVVVGTNESVGGACLWSDGVAIGLGYLAGGYASTARRVNNAGEVIGLATTDGGGDWQAFLWTQEDGMVSVATELGFSAASASDISDDGTIIGTCSFNGEERAYIWQAQTNIQLLGWTNEKILPRAINSSGEVVGAEWTGDTWRAFIFDGNNGVSYIEPPAPFDESDVGCITDSGIIAGSFTDRANNTARGFIVEDGRTEMLEPLPGSDLCYTQSINEDRIAVGSSRIGGDPDTSIPTLWKDGQAYSLGSLIQGGSDWELRYVNDINSFGQIVGWGLNPDGVQRGFLMTPIPEPSILNMMAIGGLAMIRCLNCSARQITAAEVRKRFW